jgi:hypothetical protein
MTVAPKIRMNGVDFNDRHAHCLANASDGTLLRLSCHRPVNVRQALFRTGFL